MSNKKLNAIITIGGAISSTFNTVVRSTTSQLRRVGSEITRLRNQQNQLGSAIQTFGRMGRNVDNLRHRYSELTNQLSRLRQEQERLTRAAERHSRLSGIGSKTMSTGMAVGASGGVILAGMHAPIEQAKHYETEVTRIRALGLDAAAVARTEKYAKDFKAFGNSQLDKLELMRDSLAIFGGDEHHAEMAMPTVSKMKFANNALFGKEAGAEKTKQLQDMLKVIELRGGAKDQKSFETEANWIQKVISSTGGRVQGDEWRKVIATGGLAAKSMKSDIFYKLLEPLVQEMGGDRAGTGLMSAYSSLYQGRTTKRAARNLESLGLIGDQSKVKHDKSGQLSFMDPGALLGSDIFRRNQLEWIEKILLPQLAKQGITGEDKILDTIGSLVSNRKGADYLSTLFLQRQQIHKSMALTDKSADINTVEGLAKNTSAGKEEELRARKDNALLAIGQQVLPLYVKGLEFAANALEKLNGFIERNPRFTKIMVVGLTAVGAALAVLGPLLIGGGGLIWGFGQFVMLGARLAPILGGIGRFASSAAGAITRFGSSGTVIRSVFTVAINVIKQVGFALLRTPWGAVAAIVIAAGLAIYKYWDWIKAFFIGFWEGLKAGIKPFTDAIGDLIKAVPFLATAWDFVSTAISKVWNWFKELLTPVKASKEQIEGAKNAGVRFGELVGGALSLVLTPLRVVVDLFTWILNFGEKVFDWIGKIASFDIGQKVSSIFSSTKQAESIVNNTQPTSWTVAQKAPNVQIPMKAPNVSMKDVMKYHDPATPSVQNYLPQNKQNSQSQSANQAPQQTNHNTFSFTINAPANSDSNQIAHDVMRKLKQAQGIQQRGSMMDWGYSQ